eukprot:COSAG01_NODE_73155_length_251_cov_0.618421_1_plen_43_part_10
MDSEHGASITIVYGTAPGLCAAYRVPSVAYRVRAARGGARHPC